jgi:hypothetical protein
VRGKPPARRLFLRRTRPPLQARGAFRSTAPPPHALLGGGASFSRDPDTPECGRLVGRTLRFFAAQKTVAVPRMAPSQPIHQRRATVVRCKLRPARRRPPPSTPALLPAAASRQAATPSSPSCTAVVGPASSRAGGKGPSQPARAGAIKIPREKLNPNSNACPQISAFCEPKRLFFSRHTVSA